MIGLVKAGWPALWLANGLTETPDVFLGTNHAVLGARPALGDQRIPFSIVSEKIDGFLQ